MAKLNKNKHSANSIIGIFCSRVSLLEQLFNKHQTSPDVSFINGQSLPSTTQDIYKLQFLWNTGASNLFWCSLPAMSITSGDRFVLNLSFGPFLGKPPHTRLSVIHFLDGSCPDLNGKRPRWRSAIWGLLLGGRGNYGGRLAFKPELSVLCFKVFM